MKGQCAELTVGLELAKFLVSLRMVILLDGSLLITAIAATQLALPLRVEHRLPPPVSSSDLLQTASMDRRERR